MSEERSESLGLIWPALQEKVFKREFRLGEHLHILNSLLHTMDQNGDFYFSDTYPVMESLIANFALDAGYGNSFGDAVAKYEPESLVATDILLADPALPHISRKSIIFTYIDEICKRHVWNKQQASTFERDVTAIIYADNAARYNDALHPPTLPTKETEE